MDISINFGYVRKIKFWDHFTIGTYAMLLLQSGLRIALRTWKGSPFKQTQAKAGAALQTPTS